MSMRTRALFHLTVGGLLLGGAIGAQAANLGFLNDTPISYMKQRDVDSINEGTGNSVKIDATITIASTAKDGERTCRDVGVVLNAKGQSMTLRPQFCKQGSGNWQLQKKR
jgi:hypothetical protein